MPGPNAASHRATSAARASSAARSASSGARAQKCVPLTQVPDTRARRTSRPSIAIRGSSREPTLITPSYGLPTATLTCSRSRGSSAPSSAAVRSPASARIRSTDASTSLNQASSQPPGPNAFMSEARSLRAIAGIVEWCTTGTSSAGTTNTVRRIPVIRTSVCSAYRARSTGSGPGASSRAPADRNTVAGSVPCNATTASAASSGVPTLTASRCRKASRARRSRVETLTKPPQSAPSLIHLTHRREGPLIRKRRVGARGLEHRAVELIVTGDRHGIRWDPSVRMMSHAFLPARTGQEGVSGHCSSSGGSS